MKNLFLMLLVILLAGSLILGGCTKQTPTPAPSPAPAPSPTPAPLPAPAPALTPKFGGVYKIATRDKITSFGVPLNIRTGSKYIANYALERVIQRSDTDPRGYEGVLAESYELTPDKSAYIFHLRKGVKFTDGTDFNALAVKYNWDKVLALKPASQIFKKVSSFDVLDDYTIRANLTTWDVLILEDFVYEFAYIMSPTAYEKNGEEWCNTHPVGTGPFMLEEYIPMQKHRFVRNPDYWDQPYPYLDGVEWLCIPDDMTAMAAFIAGEVDGLNQVPIQTGTDLVAKGYKLKGSIIGGTYAIQFGTTKSTQSAWSDVRMRQALEYAIDKEKISQALGGGFTSPIYEILRGSNQIANPGTTPRKYDPVKAKQLMAEAGYENGLNVKLTVLEKFYGDHVVALQEQLAKVGITVDIDVAPAPVWNELIFKEGRGSELWWDRARGRPNNIGILSYLNSDYASTTIYYPGVTRPAGFDALLDQARYEMDPAKRIDLISQMEKLMYDDVFLVPFLYFPDIEFVPQDLKWDPKVHESIWFTSADTLVLLQYAWLDR